MRTYRYSFPSLPRAFRGRSDRPYPLDHPNYGESEVSDPKQPPPIDCSFPSPRRTPRRTTFIFPPRASGQRHERRPRRRSAPPNAARTLWRAPGRTDGRAEETETPRKKGGDGGGGGRARRQQRKPASAGWMGGQILSRRAGLARSGRETDNCYKSELEKKELYQELDSNITDHAISYQWCIVRHQTAASP